MCLCFAGTPRLLSDCREVRTEHTHRSPTLLLFSLVAPVSDTSNFSVKSEKVKQNLGKQIPRSYFFYVKKRVTSTGQAEHRNANGDSGRTKSHGGGSTCAIGGRRARLGMRPAPATASKAGAPQIRPQKASVQVCHLGPLCHVVLCGPEEYAI